MNIEETEIYGAYVVTQERHEDFRGGLSRLYCSRTLSEIIGDKKINQINYSTNNYAGTVRGMHFQFYPAQEMKIVACLSGQVLDVVVDLRKGSTTFSKVITKKLSPKIGNAIIIPEGCAHGYQTLEDNTSLVYFHSGFYSPKLDGRFSYLDPLVKDKWEIEIGQVSDRDRLAAPLPDGFVGYDFIKE